MHITHETEHILYIYVNVRTLITITTMIIIEAEYDTYECDAIFLTLLSPLQWRQEPVISRALQNI